MPEGFETEALAYAEDRTRAKGLGLARPTEGPTSWTNIAARIRLLDQLPFPRSFPRREAANFDRVRLRLATAPGPISNSLASSSTMRIIRETVISDIHAAFAGYPDEALATATVINQRWTYTPANLDAVTAKQVKNRFRSDLNNLGLTKVPGPFIAILHGEFEPRSGQYVLHFHILTTWEKAEILKGLKARPGSQAFPGYCPTASGAAPVVCKAVHNRERQFSYLLKSYWPSRTIRRINGVWKRDRRPRRICEPFASQVLVWLDRQRLRDLVIMHDCWSMRNGGTPAMKRLYLSVFGAW
ncbi:hypothetical protein [Methylobacterium sp. WL19]|uniref:hypothetical protein n=1 Tax=Methylobacterium sp. WL19 TaxID=2603896 RepID=UPI0011C865AB|nr:hypothetical protein [Methylobacterium sp. WL19]TXN21409.1 hypothetical protein FV220_23100 [Methylobacterium sp. WL19]